MNNLIIANVNIHQDSEGRYSLNDLHKSAISDGANARTKEPSKFLASPQIHDLIEELTDTQNMGIAPVNSVKGGLDQGTYVCKELVYAYAMWISPTFHLKVIRTFDAVVSGQITDPMKALNDPDFLRGALLTYTEKVIALEERVGELQPKAEALDRIAKVTDGSMCITDAAKHLDIAPKQLFTFLSCKEWIYRRLGNKNWVGYQDKIQQGLLEHKIVVIGSDDDGNDKTAPQVRITRRGLTKLSELLIVDRAG